jgi:dihydropteroate synthase
MSLARVRIMGILNTTPDSFYDGGWYLDPGAAVDRAEEMVFAGADIVDIGGEKAGPGDPVSIKEELRRVVPVVAAVRRAVSVPVSVDTIKPEVARAAIDAGAGIINSIDGFRDPEMRRVAAQTGVAIVVMHIKGRPRVANPRPRYQDVVREVAEFIQARIADCLTDNIDPRSIVIDPGPDFGKTTEQTIEILRHLDRLTAMHFPVLLSISRKRFIGEVLNATPDARLVGSLAVTAWGVLQGVKIVRTHDIRATKRVVVMTEAVLNPGLVDARSA